MNTPNNLLTFSIEAWKQRPLDVVTRDGHKVIVAGYNPEAKSRERLVGWCSSYGALMWHEDGKVHERGDGHSNDLFMLPETKEVFVNIGTNGLGLEAGLLNTCMDSRTSSALAVCKFTIRGKEVTAEIVHKYE